MDKPKYITQKKGKNGVITYYYNIPARCVPDGCDIIKHKKLGTNKWQAYSEADRLNNYVDGFKHNKPVVNKKSIKYLWGEYQEIRIYKALKDRTKKQYQKSYEYISTRSTPNGIELKDVSLDLFTRKSVDKLYERFLETTNIFDVKKHFDFLRLIYKFGIKERVFRSDIENPFSDMRIKLPKSNKKKNIIKQHVEILIKKARELKEDAISLAIDLNYYLCQRPEDILEIRKKDLYWSNNILFVTIEQNKVDGTIVNLPIPKHLVKEVLSKEDYIIFDSFGNFSVDRFSRRFKKVKDSLGDEFKDYEWRTLRHTGGNAMLEAGVPIEQVTAFTGHKSSKTFTEYYKVVTENMVVNAQEIRDKNEKKSESRKNKVRK